jgi:Cu/Ag efflux protein CusF
MFQRKPARLRANNSDVPVTMRITARRPASAGFAIVAALALSLFAGTTALAATPCCKVIDIAANGQVTAREINGTRTISFQVSDIALLRGLKSGAPVYANFDTKQVSLDGKKVCCKILNTGTVAKQPEPAASAAVPKEKPSGTATPSKQTTVQVPKVDVTASEGSTATAIRGKPATSATGDKQPRGSTAPALPAVKSVTAGAVLKTGSSTAGTATGGREVVLRVELTGPAPCVERCGGKTVNGLPSGYMRVMLSSDNAAQFALQQMFVNTGQTAGEANFVTVPVVTPTTFTISAWSEGSAPQRARLTVQPPLMTDFTISKSDVVSGEGVQGVVHFSGPPASANAVKFQVQTTNGQVVQVPAVVALEPNKTAAEFSIATLGVPQDRNVHVVAMYLDKTLPAPLTVRAARIKDVEQEWPCCRSPFWIHLDGLPPPSGAVIELKSEDPSEIAVPPSVTIPVGATKISVTPQEIPGNTHRHITIRASYRGESKSHWVWSVKLVKPDIVIREILFYDANSNVITAAADGQPIKMCATVHPRREGELMPNVPVPESVLRISYQMPTGTGTSSGRTTDYPVLFTSEAVTHCLMLPGITQGSQIDVTLIADFRSEVDESREGNNTKKVKISRPQT